VERFSAIRASSVKLAGKVARVAVGPALPRLAAVDERHGKPALDQMKRDRGADDTGSQHNNVTARQENLRCG